MSRRSSRRNLPELLTYGLSGDYANNSQVSRSPYLTRSRTTGTREPLSVGARSISAARAAEFGSLTRQIGHSSSTNNIATSTSTSSRAAPSSAPIEELIQTAYTTFRNEIAHPQICVICLSESKTNPSVLLPCLHLFCFGCINRWININPTCPLCKISSSMIVYSMNSATEYESLPVQAGANNPSGLNSMQQRVTNYRIVIDHIRETLHGLESRPTTGLSTGGPLDLTIRSPGITIDFMDLMHGGNQPANATGINSIENMEMQLENFIKSVVHCPFSSMSRRILNPQLRRQLVYTLRLQSVRMDTTVVTRSNCVSRAFLSNNEVALNRLAGFVYRELNALLPWLATSEFQLSSTCHQVVRIIREVGLINGQLFLQRLASIPRLDLVPESFLTTFFNELHRFAIFIGTLQEFDDLFWLVNRTYDPIYVHSRRNAHMSMRLKNLLREYILAQLVRPHQSHQVSATNTSSMLDTSGTRCCRVYQKFAQFLRSFRGTNLRTQNEARLSTLLTICQCQQAGLQRPPGYGPLGLIVTHMFESLSGTGNAVAEALRVRSSAQNLISLDEEEEEDGVATHALSSVESSAVSTQHTAGSESQAVFTAPPPGPSTSSSSAFYEPQQRRNSKRASQTAPGTSSSQALVSCSSDEEPDTISQFEQNQRNQRLEQSARVKIRCLRLHDSNEAPLQQQPSTSSHVLNTSLSDMEIDGGTAETDAATTNTSTLANHNGQQPSRSNMNRKVADWLAMSKLRYQLKHFNRNFKRLERLQPQATAPSFSVVTSDDEDTTDAHQLQDTAARSNSTGVTNSELSEIVPDADGLSMVTSDESSIGSIRTFAFRHCKCGACRKARKLLDSHCSMLKSMRRDESSSSLRRLIQQHATKRPRPLGGVAMTDAVHGCEPSTSRPGLHEQSRLASDIPFSQLLASTSPICLSDETDEEDIRIEKIEPCPEPPAVTEQSRVDIYQPQSVADFLAFVTESTSVSRPTVSEQDATVLNSTVEILPDSDMEVSNPDWSTSSSSISPTDRLRICKNDEDSSF